MAAITIFSRNNQETQFQGMLMGLEYKERRKFLTTFYGDRSKIQYLARSTDSIIVDDIDVELM